MLIGNERIGSKHRGRAVCVGLIYAASVAAEVPVVICELYTAAA
jgi:hypothetical protein